MLRERLPGRLPGQLSSIAATDPQPPSPVRSSTSEWFQIWKHQPSSGSGSTRKRTPDELGTTVDRQRKKPKTERRQSTILFVEDSRPTKPSEEPKQDLADQRKILGRIQSHPTLTPYRKRLYATLLSVPRGRYTTYAAMSDYLGSSARAVGNGMRNNPFAPDVPCHRVLAANGTIGGFKGDWGKDGKHADQKVELLRNEGVRFDGSGKVIGEPFRRFHNFSESGGMNHHQVR